MVTDDDDPYGDAEDITPLVFKVRARLKRLYGENYELSPPPHRAPFSPFPTDEARAFHATHRPPPQQFGNVQVVRKFHTPGSYFVDATCACDWCVSCREHGIVPLANQPGD